MTKPEFRKLIKTKQKENLSDLKKIHDSYRISQIICASKEFAEAEYIFAFMPLPDEVNVGGIIVESFLKNKKVAVPLITDKEGLMEFQWITSETKMIPGSYGIYEPPVNPVEMNTIKNALLLVPGLSFSKSGKRLGRGKGFYDRFLSQYGNKFKKIGVCFDFQIEENLVTEENDISVDQVIF